MLSSVIIKNCHLSATFSSISTDSSYLDSSHRFWKGHLQNFEKETTEFLRNLKVTLSHNPLAWRIIKLCHGSRQSHAEADGRDNGLSARFSCLRNYWSWQLGINRHNWTVELVNCNVILQNTSLMNGFLRHCITMLFQVECFIQRRLSLYHVTTLFRLHSSWTVSSDKTVWKWSV